MTSRVYNDTDTVITNSTGNYILDNTSTTKAIALRLGTDTNTTNFEVRNNLDTSIFSVAGDGATTFNGATTFSGATATFNANSTFNTITTFTQDVSFGDDNYLYLGAENDLRIVHGGTNTNITSTTGDLIVENTNTAGSTIFKLGTATNATDFIITDSADSAKFTTYASGQVVISSDKLSIGNVAYTWPGNDGSVNQFLQTNGEGTLTWATSSATVATGNFVINDSGLTSPSMLFYKRSNADITSGVSIVSGTTTSSGSSITLVDNTSIISESPASLYQCLVKLTSGLDSGTIRCIIDYNYIDTITVDEAFPNGAPDPGTTYEIYDKRYPALVFDNKTEVLKIAAFRNTDSYSSIVGAEFPFHTGTFRANGLITMAAGANCPSGQTIFLGSGSDSQATLGHSGTDLYITSTNNTTITISDIYTGAYNTASINLGSNTGNTRFEVTDSNMTPKFTVNSNGNVSIVDCLFKHSTTTTTSSGATILMSNNCTFMNSFTLESDIVASTTYGSGYLNLYAQTFKLIASFVKSARQTFIQVGSTDKLTIGGQIWDASVSTSGAFVKLNVTPKTTSHLSWKSLNKIIYSQDLSFPDPNPP